MIFKVQMLAMEPPKMVREVNVPDAEVSDDTIDMLHRIVHYGQNDFQPVDMCCSVSKRDVIEYKGDPWLILANGFRKLTSEELALYKSTPRRDRDLLPLFDD